MQFDTLNWDEFWQKKLEATMQERTQTALDSFEVTSPQHRKHTERLVFHLQDSFPDVEFAAENWVGSWQIYARTPKQRKLSSAKMEKVQNAAERILENVELKYPIDTLPKENSNHKEKSGCLGVMLAVMATSAAMACLLAFAITRQYKP